MYIGYHQLQKIMRGEDPVAKAPEWLHAIESDSVQYPNNAIARDAWKGREYQRALPKTVKWSFGKKTILKIVFCNLISDFLQGVNTQTLSC